MPPLATLVTSMFLHGGWMHLLGNMLYLWIFGNNVEDRLGHGRYLLFYLATGLAAAAAQVLPDPASQIPMVGASGAISGVLGAYVVLFPHARVLVLIPLGLAFFRYIRAVWVLGIWFGMQIASALVAPARRRCRMVGACRRLRCRPRARPALAATHHGAAATRRPLGVTDRLAEGCCRRTRPVPSSRPVLASRC